MGERRSHHEVVSELTALQARLRAESPSGARAAEGVSLIEGDLQIRAGVDPWRNFPEFNLVPQDFDVTIDDRIALLQHDIRERIDVRDLES